MTLATFASVINLLKIPVGAILLGGFAAADLWHFHALSATTDVSYLVAAAAALGVSTAFTAGQAVAATKAQAVHEAPPPVV